MDIRYYKAVIILFAPGQGGEHLANIISTSAHIENIIAKRVDNKYHQDLQYYCSSGAKDSTTSKVGFVNTTEICDMLSEADKPWVIAGHIDETYYLYEYIKNLGPYVFITFEHFNLTDYIKRRMQPYDDGLVRLLYREKVVSKLFDTKNGMALDPAKLFEESPYDLLSDLSRDLSLDLDLDFCLDLHKKWFNKIK